MNWQARLTNWQTVEAVREFIVKMHDSMILFWKRILSSSIKRTKVYIVEKYITRSNNAIKKLQHFISYN